VTILYIVVGVLIASLLFALLLFVWAPRPLRPKEPGFRYVYVNPRGQARELCAEEREWVSQRFEPDGDRPPLTYRYEKYDITKFRSGDPTKFIPGFIDRRYLPLEVEIVKLTPEEDMRTARDNQAVLEDRGSTPRRR
jgi:hypothetical protein